MTIADVYLEHAITYWGGPIYDEYGNGSFDAPVSIFGRWEKRADRMINNEGVEFITKSQIFLKQEAALGGYIYLGTDLNPDPLDVVGAELIQRVDFVDSLDGIDREWRIYT